jgi:hypothetical protein
MGKSRAIKVAPQGTAHWVTWRTKETTHGVKGKWCLVKPAQPSLSVQPSPTKTPAKKDSDRAWHQFSTDFNADYKDLGGHPAIGALNLHSGRKKMKVNHIFMTAAVS